MRRTSGYTRLDNKRSAEILEDHQVHIVWLETYPKDVSKQNSSTNGTLPTTREKELGSTIETLEWDRNTWPNTR